MSIITGMRLVSGLTAGSITAANLTAIIATPAGAAGWKAAMSSPALAQQLVQDPTARAAWMGSTEAVNAAVKLRSFMRAWMSHPDALDGLMSTASSVTALLDSREARIALWSHDPALIALGLSATASAAAKASNKLKLASGNIEANVPGIIIQAAGRFILLSGQSSWGGAPITAVSKRPGAGISSSIFFDNVEKIGVVPLVGPATFSQSQNVSLIIKYFQAD